VDAVPDKIGHLLKSGVDGIKLYFTMPPDTAKAIIEFVDKRVPVTAHLGYTHSLDAIKFGIDGLEHMWISPYNEFCALNLRFGPGASMMDPNFWTLITKGWEEADLMGEGARTWFGAMVDKQVNMGTTLDLLWIGKFGSDAAQRDPDRRYIPPKALARQRAMAKYMGKRPGLGYSSRYLRSRPRRRGVGKTSGSDSHPSRVRWSGRGRNRFVEGYPIRRRGLPCSARSSCSPKRSGRWRRSRP
jgi:hypothetical protein